MSECEKYLEMISAQIDHELSPGEERKLERHLESCPSCRRVKDAFLAVSGTADEELVQPPEELAASVMQRIRETDKSGEGRREKSRSNKRIYLKRYLALAACTALIIMTASSRLQVIYGGFGVGDVTNGAADHTELFEARSTDAGAPEEAEAQDEEASGQDVDSRATREEDGAPAPTPMPQEDADLSAPENEAALQEIEGHVYASSGVTCAELSVADTLSQLFSGTVSLSDPDAAEPFFSYTDSEGPATLLSFLGNALDEDAGEVPSEVPTVIISLSVEERSFQLEVWSSGESILCLYSELSTANAEKDEELFFRTDGSAESFRSYIDTLRNLVS